MNGKVFVCQMFLIIFIVGIVSADTLIVYPTADGYAYDLDDALYPTIRNATGDGRNTADVTSQIRLIASTNESLTPWSALYRGTASYNTSTIDDAATIASVILRIKIANRATVLGTQDIGITGGAWASNTSLATGDYDGFSNTEFTDSRVSCPAVTNDMNFTFNAAGVTYVQNRLTGISHTILYARDSWDLTNTPPAWVSAGNSLCEYYDLTRTTVGDRPYLEITYSLGSTPPTASFTCTKNLIRIPNTVTCTDSSTNTPTSWSWNMGDGSAAVTTQNVTYRYLKRGSWGITLNATNTAGSNTTPTATNVRVVGYENYW